jgi:PAS domain S-box-containing protein
LSTLGGAESFLGESQVGQAVLSAAENADMGVVIIVSDTDGPKNAYMNEAVLRLLGRTREEVAARPLLDFLAPEFRERAVELSRMRAAGLKAPARVETAIIRPDGTRVPIVSVTGELKLNGKPAAVAFVWDVSERVNAERGRLEEAQRLKRVFDAAPDGIALVRGPIILRVNAAGARMLGFETPEKAVGISLADLMLPEEVPMMMRRMKASAEGVSQPSQVYRVRRSDGSIVSAEVSSIPFEHEGKPALLAFVRDVTERSQIQEQLARAERLASLSTLAAGLAHEVNNPLTAAMLQLDVIEQTLASSLGGMLPNGLTERITELRQTQVRIAEVMRDFAAFARSGDEKRERVDLREILCAVERMLAPMLSKKGTYQSTIDTLPAVHGDPSRLEQVFVNLLLNAVQALPEGRPGNSIELRGRLVPDGRVCVEVIDNGVGITAGNLRRVFDPFFTTKPVGVGTGLGLTVCHNIVSSYGGVIEIDSVCGHGCTLRVLLPAAQTLPGLPLVKPGRTRVMIVDDEPHLANTLRMLLEDRHDVVATTQSEQAVRILIEGAPIDVVLCDVMMPDPNGMEVFRRVTERRPELRSRFIFMTGGTYTVATEKFLEATSAPTVQKPFDATSVEKLIARVAAQ